MNATVEVETDLAFPQAAVPLLKEYAQKLTDLAEATLHSNARSGEIRDELIGRFKHLKTPVTELIHQVSAAVNEGRWTGLTRIELWLRLAELEHGLETAMRRIELIKPRK